MRLGRNRPVPAGFERHESHVGHDRWNVVGSLRHQSMKRALGMLHAVVCRDRSRPIPGMVDMGDERNGGWLRLSSRSGWGFDMREYGQQQGEKADDDAEVVAT